MRLTVCVYDHIWIKRIIKKIIIVGFWTTYILFGKIKLTKKNTLMPSLDVEVLYKVPPCSLGDHFQRVSRYERRFSQGSRALVIADLCSSNGKITHADLSHDERGKYCGDSVFISQRCAYQTCSSLTWNIYQIYMPSSISPLLRPSEQSIW